MVELFKSSKSNISEHIKNIFAEGELEETSVVRKFRTTAADGKSYLTALVAAFAAWGCAPFDLLLRSINLSGAHQGVICTYMLCHY